MKKILADIQGGIFTRNWMLENRVNQTSFKATRARYAAHPIEKVGEQLRGMMPWIKEKALVDKSRRTKGGSALQGRSADPASETVPQSGRQCP